MNFLISDGWSTRFKSLTYKPTRDSWDSVTATIWHRGLSIPATRALYPRYLPVSLGLGFYVTESEVRPAARLPGVVVADVQMLGAFQSKIQGTGAASAHSESPSNILIPGIPALQRNILWQKTDILVCEPTFEVMALDAVAPDLKGVGTGVLSAYGGVPLPTPPPNPFNFSLADVVANRTVRYPYGWCFIGLEYERVGLIYLKRYYYTFRHLVTP